MLMSDPYRQIKVYRYTCAQQQNIATEEANLPPLLQDINNAIDVTSEYGACADVSLPVWNGHPKQKTAGA